MKRQEDGLAFAFWQRPKAKRASKAEEQEEPDSPRRDGPRATPAWQLRGGAPPPAGVGPSSPTAC